MADLWLKGRRDRRCVQRWHIMVDIRENGMKYSVRACACFDFSNLRRIRQANPDRAAASELFRFVDSPIPSICVGNSKFHHAFALCTYCSSLIPVMGRGNRKRKHAQFEEDSADGEGTSTMGVGATLAHLRDEARATPEHGEKAQEPPSEEWTTVGKGGKKQKTTNYPSLGYSDLHKLQCAVNINHLQGLVLYCLADGSTAPSWVSVRHHGLIKKAVVLFVPGLEKGMFDWSIDVEPKVNTPIELSSSSNGVQESNPPGDALIGVQKSDDANPATKDRTMSNPFIDPSIRSGKIRMKALIDKFMTEPSLGANSKPSTEADGYSVKSTPKSPDDYLPIKLAADELPLPLKQLADMFPYIWPVKAPGDERMGKVHSPLHAMLNSPLTRTQEERNHDKQTKGAKPARAGKDWENTRTPITQYISSKEELLENEYTLHPAWSSKPEEKAAAAQRRVEDKQTSTDGWEDTLVEDLESGTPDAKDIQKGSMTAGRSIIALDCEMCRVEGGEMALTRISLIDWDGTVIMDELVKPDKAITDYLTPYSGITPSKLANITTTLSSIQTRLLNLITPQHILIGHSLNSDLLAIKLTHPFIIDTSILYPHPRGPPMKSSLKWLAQKYLHGREIQKGHGTQGHDSVEDARACLDLVKVKCEKGPQWGTNAATCESIFKRLKRTPKSGITNNSENGKTGAIVDHGSPEKNFGAMATYTIGCKTDAEVVAGVKRAVLGDEDGAYIPGGGVDFTWARFQELAALRGWLLDYRHSGTPYPSSPPSTSELAAAVTKTVQHIKDIRDSLPPCTLFIVYSGTGDPREMARLQEMQRTFRREFQVKKWDQLSVKWTDVEEQALKGAVRRAREGVGFVNIT